MADDGLLLNFDVGNIPLAPTQHVKGGTWRARRREQKRDQALRSKVNTPGQKSSTAEAASKKTRDPRKGNEFASKRRKLDGEFKPAKRLTNPTDEPSSIAKKPTSEAGRGAERQVISSLFTYNPPSNIGKQKAQVEEEDRAIEPSNAPLTKEELNFTTLGLNSSIATHLTRKLGVTAPTAIQKSAIPQLLEDDSDAFIQAETGSGKTLAYLLPILQRLVQISQDRKRAGQEPLDRHSGLFAIILAPTRELSKQITVVLENLLHCATWLVSSSVVGGEKKKSEKARLRKGVSILVATPGRLVDHLDHTEALDVSNVRWLVLDEGDRLMELGFEEDIKKITNKLDNRMKMSKQSPVEGLPPKRMNILCSATLKHDVQRLGDLSLKDAKDIKPDKLEEQALEEVQPPTDSETKFSAPSQLKQSYAIVPAKQRLVMLIALLKRTFSRKDAVNKAIVFLSCADSVDFHFEVLTRSENQPADSDSDESIDKFGVNSAPKANEKRPRSTPNAQLDSTSPDPTTSAKSSLVSSSQSITAFRLHGSLPQKIRTKTIHTFANSKKPAFLLCTDVASRGLDVPNVDLVIEYDPAFSRDEHLHRIGRTARAGRDGRATIFLMPGCEEGYVSVLKSAHRDSGVGVAGHSAEEILRKGFSTSGKTVKEAEAGWQDRATELQLDVERWVLDSPRILEMARRGFQSHVRAYATHVTAERGFFDIKQLHLGHLAKAFGLRDPPGRINVPGMRASAGKVKSERKMAGKKQAVEKSEDGAKDGRKRKANLLGGVEQDVDEAKRKMRAKVKMMERASVGEFNLA